jgi:hypothetical protein
MSSQFALFKLVFQRNVAQRAVRATVTYPCGQAPHTRSNDHCDFFGLKIFREKLNGVVIGNRRNRILSLGAEEGRITGSYKSGIEAYGSIKRIKYFDKLVDFQNHMGALSPKELFNNRSLNLLTNTISRTRTLLYILRRRLWDPPHLLFNRYCSHYPREKS